MKYFFIVGILSIINPLFGQTKTEKETIKIDTDNPAITMEAKKNGTYLEVRVYNNHNVSYTISFTTEVTIRGIKGDVKKILQTSGDVAPNKSNYAFTNIGWADVSNDIYFSLEEASNINFSAQLVDNQNKTYSNYSNNNTNSKNTSSVNHNPKPGPNASVQELAAWQRRQNTVKSTSTTTSSSQNYNNYETRYNTNPQVKEAVERQNRLQNLQQQQEQQQKAQQQANYEKAIAYEQKRQESIQQTNEVVDAVTNAITDYLYQQAEEKKRKQEAEERRLEREYEQRMAEYERKTAIEAKINNRKTAIAEFPVKDIPLGSQEKAQSIYYFVYAYDNSINNEYGATIFVSNVFEIGKYADDTRIYTSIIKNEISTLTPFTEVLHGYYYTTQEAEGLRQTLISILQNNGVDIQEVTYKGKPTTKSTTQKTIPSKYGKTISTNSDNLAPAKLNDAKPSEVTKQNLEKAKEKESKYGKTIKIN